MPLTLGYNNTILLAHALTVHDLLDTTSATIVLPGKIMSAVLKLYQSLKELADVLIYINLPFSRPSLGCDHQTQP